MVANPTHSTLDPDWPPAAPPKGKLAVRFAYWVQWKNDPVFSFLRFFKPILKLPAGGPVLVSRFRDVTEILDRPDVFGVPYAPMIDKSVGAFMLSRDSGVYHRRDKGLMRALLQEKDLPVVKEQVRKIAEKCIEQGAPDGVLEVVSFLSRKAAILLIGKHFGFPGPDLDTMMRWSRDTQYDIFHNPFMSGKIHDNNIRAGREMRAYLKDELLPRRRKQLKKNADRDDIVSRMLSMKCPAHIGWDEESLLVNTMGLLVGGVETTSAAVVQILDQLFRRTDQLGEAQQAALHGDDAKLTSICWEALRFNPINPLVPRLCNRDYRLASGTLRNTLIKKGTVVVVGTRSAMKDPREVSRPRQFRTDRPDYQYFHLGYGMHRCLGDLSAKVMVIEIVKSLLLKKNLRRAAGKAGQIDFKNGPFPESFSVVFDD